MVQILLDEFLSVKLKHRFAESSPNFQVSTVTDEKWTGIKDGNLITRIIHQEILLFTRRSKNVLLQRSARLNFVVIIYSPKFELLPILHNSNKNIWLMANLSYFVNNPD